MQKKQNEEPEKLWSQLLFTVFLALFLGVLLMRSFQFIYRTAVELRLPLYQSPHITSAICSINPETIPIEQYHRFWYDRLGMNCKDRCE